MNYYIFAFVFVLAIAVILSVIYTMWRVGRDEQKLISIIHGSPIPTFVISKDHKVIYWNRALQALSNIKPSEVLGTNQQWRAFYNTERLCLADLILDDKTAQIIELYSREMEEIKTSGMTLMK